MADRVRRGHAARLAPLGGSAPGVGVVGDLTGGGIGPLVRSVALFADHVRPWIRFAADGFAA